MTQIDPSTIKAPSDGDKALVESLRDFIKKCPYLPELTKYVNVDYLGAEEDSFSIESVVADPVIRRYLKGSIRQYQFYFSSRESFTADVLENIQNSKFFELFTEWLEVCSRNSVLPELSADRKCLKVESTTQGYVVDSQNSKAHYMIQCTMWYYQDY